jgi:serine phosphatase RsbU (regulator of sigma subunit)
MVLYSDGITEAGESAEREFGVARLEAIITQHAEKPLDEIRQHVLKAVRDWSGEELEDDMTLLLIRAARLQKGAL